MTFPISNIFRSFVRSSVRSLARRENFSSTRKFRRRKKKLKKSLGRCDRFRQKIVEVGAILAIFEPFKLLLGTQEMFWSQPNLLYASTHQMPLFPGTGAISEVGEYSNIINVPLSAGSGGSEFRTAFNEVILPGLRKFSPDLLIVSAGFDAHADDPLAGLNLHEDDFSWVTLELLSIAEKYSEGRLVSVLEGGYNLEALSSSASVHVRQLMSV